MKKFGNLDGNIEYELLNENQHDAELREKLANLYASPFSDILYFELYEPSLVEKGFYKLFYYEQSVLKHIILFKYFAKEPKELIVINNNFKIFLKDIDNISQILFYEFGKLQQIKFRITFVLNIEQLPKMIIDKDRNDIIIPLPATIDDYMTTTLGKKTRKLIKIAIDSFKKDYPDYDIQHFENKDISFEQIEEIAKLNRNRMKLQGIKSHLTDKSCQLHHHYASTSGFGFITVCKMGEKTIGGFISSVTGEHAYGHVIAHDDSYSKYYLGQIVLVNTIKYLIENKNIKYLHMLFGQQDYKFRYGGINHDCYAVHIFRDHNLYYFFELIKTIFRRNYRMYKLKLKNQNFYKRFKQTKIIHIFLDKLK